MRFHDLNLLLILHPIHLLLEPEENTRTIEVRTVADAVKQADKSRLVADMPLHEVIKTKCDQNTQHQHDIQLDVDRTACHVAEPPAQHHEEVQDQNRKRRRGMRASQADEHVVQVRLVRVERRLALQNARRHHTERIEDRNGQDRQRKGNQSDICSIINLAHRAVAQDPDHEDRHDNTHNQRPAVTDEHLRTLAKNVVEEERNQRSGCHDGQHAHRPIPHVPEHHTEKEARQDAVARREAVYPIDQVDGIDDAHGRKDRQRNSHPLRDLIETPQSVEVIQGVSSDENQQQNRADLDQEPQRRRKIEDVIHRTGIEHDHHRNDDDEELGAVAGYTGTAQSDDRSEEDGDTAQNGSRTTLQFAGIGIVDDVLVKCDPHQTRMDPMDAQNSDQKSENI